MGATGKGGTEEKRKNGDGDSAGVKRGSFFFSCIGIIAVGVTAAFDVDVHARRKTLEEQDRVWNTKVYFVCMVLAGLALFEVGTAPLGGTGLDWLGLDWIRTLGMDRE